MLSGSVFGLASMAIISNLDGVNLSTSLDLLVHSIGYTQEGIA